MARSRARTWRPIASCVAGRGAKAARIPVPVEKPRFFTHLTTISKNNS